jgi:lauroyl/myristoyl acyltransferase
MTMEELEKRVTIHVDEVLGQALAMGKGAIIVSAHFGNMDLPSAVLAKKYARISGVAETLRPQQLNDFLTRARNANNIYLFPYDIAPRKIIEALKRNEIIGFMLDFGVTHHFDITTVPVTFFGTPTNFPAGPAQLAYLTGAPIIVGHTHVAPDGHIDAYGTPPIIVKRDGNRQQVFQTTMQKIAHRMEEFIRNDPGQWYIYRPMWRKEEISKFEIQNSKPGA